MALEKLNAVVTGGAGGLGRAFCEVLGRRQCKVVIGDIDVEGAEETAQMVERLGGEARVVRCDVRDFEQVNALSDALDDWGPAQLLINNAGVAVSGPFEQIEEEDWRWIVDINLWGVIHGCRVFIPQMKARGQGYVINVASTAGLVSMPGMAPYNVTKAAVVALSETLYGELKASGVHLTALCPTFFKTSIVTSSRGPTDQQLNDVAQRAMERSRIQAPQVARIALDDVASNRLYSVPMSDGRFFWRLKRLAPQGFESLLSKITSNTLLRKALERGIGRSR